MPLILVLTVPLPIRTLTTEGVPGTVPRTSGEVTRTVGASSLEYTQTGGPGGRRHWSSVLTTW